MCKGFIYHFLMIMWSVLTFAFSDVWKCCPSMLWSLHRSSWLAHHPLQNKTVSVHVSQHTSTSTVLASSPSILWSYPDASLQSQWPHSSASPCRLLNFSSMLVIFIHVQNILPWLRTVFEENLKFKEMESSSINNCDVAHHGYWHHSTHSPQDLRPV